MSLEFRQVTNADELMLALYDKVPILLVHGNFATYLRYGCKSLPRLRYLLIFFFVAIFAAIPVPALIIPLSIILGCIILLACVPLLFLRFAHVPMSAISDIRKQYRFVFFDFGMQELHLERFDLHSMPGTASDIAEHVAEKEQEFIGEIAAPDSRDDQPQPQPQPQFQPQPKADAKADK